MTDQHTIHYECTSSTFRPTITYPVRWLDWDRDYVLAQAMWPETMPLTPWIWQEARQARYQYCAVIEHDQIQSIAAVWRYSETAWEVAAVSTRPEVRQRGYAKAVVSFATTHILAVGKRATCSTASDNLSMQRTAESVGFYQVNEQ